MERWNIGMLILKENFSFINLFAKRSFPNIPLSHFPKTPCFIIPSFHRSIIPIVSEANKVLGTCFVWPAKQVG